MGAMREENNLPELLPLRSAAPRCLLLAVFIVALWLRLLPVVVLLLAWGAAVTVSLLPLACLIGVAARDDVQPQHASVLGRAQLGVA